jgi:hypothetical protein
MLTYVLFGTERRRSVCRLPGERTDELLLDRNGARRFFEILEQFSTAAGVGCVTDFVSRAFALGFAASVRGTRVTGAGSLAKTERRPNDGDRLVYRSSTTWRTVLVGVPSRAG